MKEKENNNNKKNNHRYTTDDKTLCAIYFSQNGYNCAILLLLLFLIETYTSYCAEKKRTLFLISWNFIPSKRRYPKRIDKILLLLQNWSVQKQRCRKKKDAFVFAILLINTTQN